MESGEAVAVEAEKISESSEVEVSVQEEALAAPDSAEPAPDDPYAAVTVYEQRPDGLYFVETDPETGVETATALASVLSEDWRAALETAQSTGEPTLQIPLVDENTPDHLAFVQWTMEATPDGNVQITSSTIYVPAAPEAQPDGDVAPMPAPALSGPPAPEVSFTPDAPSAPTDVALAPATPSPVAPAPVAKSKPKPTPIAAPEAAPVSAAPEIAPAGETVPTVPVAPASPTTTSETPHSTPDARPIPETRAIPIHESALFVGPERAAAAAAAHKTEAKVAATPEPQLSRPETPSLLDFMEQAAQEAPQTETPTTPNPEPTPKGGGEMMQPATSTEATPQPVSETAPEAAVLVTPEAAPMQTEVTSEVTSTEHHDVVEAAPVVQEPAVLEEGKTANLRIEPEPASVATTSPSITEAPFVTDVTASPSQSNEVSRVIIDKPLAPTEVTEPVPASEVSIAAQEVTAPIKATVETQSQLSPSHSNEMTPIQEPVAPASAEASDATTAPETTTPINTPIKTNEVAPVAISEPAMQEPASPIIVHAPKATSNESLIQEVPAPYTNEMTPITKTELSINNDAYATEASDVTAAPETATPVNALIKEVTPVAVSEPATQEPGASTIIRAPKEASAPAPIFESTSTLDADEAAPVIAAEPAIIHDAYAINGTEFHLSATQKPEAASTPTTSKETPAYTPPEATHTPSRFPWETLHPAPSGAITPETDDITINLDETQVRRAPRRARATRSTTV